MSPHLKTTKNLSRKKIVRKTSRGKLWLTNTVLLLILLLGAGFYVFQVTVSTTQGFTLRQLDKSATNLKQTNWDLSEVVNNHKSINYIASQAEQLQMVSSSQIDYLSPIASGVAVRP
jgi:cell division protein FtsB